MSRLWISGSDVSWPSGSRNGAAGQRPTRNSEPAPPPDSRTERRDGRARIEFDVHKKSAGIGYALWFFLGLLGAHRFYADRGGSGLGIPVLFIFGMVLVAAGDEAASVLGAMLAAAGILWAIADAFFIGGWIRKYNEALMQRVLRTGGADGDEDGTHHSSENTECFDISPGCGLDGVEGDIVCSQCGLDLGLPCDKCGALVSRRDIKLVDGSVYCHRHIARAEMR